MTDQTRAKQGRRNRRSASQLFLAALVVLGVLASVLLLFSDSLQWMRVGVLSGLWAAVIGAFAMTKYRRDAVADQARAKDLQTVYELQLAREISARREYELSVEAKIRDETRFEADEVAALRDELAALRQNLQVLFEGNMPTERMALRAEATRMQELGGRGYGSYQPAPSGLYVPGGRDIVGSSGFGAGSGGFEDAGNGVDPSTNGSGTNGSATDGSATDGSATDGPGTVQPADTVDVDAVEPLSAEPTRRGSRYEPARASETGRRRAVDAEPLDAQPVSGVGGQNQDPVTAETAIVDADDAGELPKTTGFDSSDQTYSAAARPSAGPRPAARVTPPVSPFTGYDFEENRPPAPADAGVPAFVPSERNQEDRAEIGDSESAFTEAATIESYEYDVDYGSNRDTDDTDDEFELSTDTGPAPYPPAASYEPDSYAAHSPARDALRDSADAFFGSASTDTDTDTAEGAATEGDDIVSVTAAEEYVTEPRRGRRRAEADGEDTGAHSNGRSVADIMAGMQGGDADTASTPRRRRRAE